MSPTGHDRRVEQQQTPPPGDGALHTLGTEGLGLLLAFVRFAGWRAATGAGLIALGAVFDGVGLLLLVPILELAIGSGGGHALAIPFARSLFERLRLQDPDLRLLALLAGFCVLMGVRGLVLYSRDRAIDRLQFEFVRRTRMGLVQTIADAGWRRTSRVRHTRVVQALSEEIHTVGAAANAGLTTVVSLAVLAGNCALALLLAPAAGAVALGVALAVVLVSQPFLRSSRRLGRAILEAHFGMTGGALALLAGLKLATAEGLQRRFVAAFDAASSAATRDRLAFAGLQTGLRNLTTTLGALIGAAILFAGIAVFHLPAPVLITLLLVLARMNGPALAVQQGVQLLLHSLPAFGAIQALEQELAEAVPPSPGRASPVLAPRIAQAGEGVRFEHVSFQHPDGAGALDDVSLELPAGAFVGLTGPSGSGKTTFLDLVAGVLEPQAGRITVHGLPIESGAPPAHRAGVAYVAQDPFLFDDTVRRNLQWSCPGRTDAELHAAIDLVGAGGLIARLQQGLDTRIGERGVLVSAGERQRLALARAVLRRPALLILDEATNAIDVASERAILQHLSALRPATTLLMVAHRRESLDLCDHRLELPGLSLTACPTGEIRRPSSIRR